MPRWIAAMVLGVGLLFGMSVQAALGPQALVKETTEQVLSEIGARKAELERDPRAAFPIVKEIVLPHFDFELMSRFVLARNWKTATPEQQERFVEAFRELLIHTYATSLAEYSGQKVKFLPVQDETGDRVLVRTEIVQKAGPNIPVDYQLHRTADGWKVFDVVIDGLSLVQNYRSSFASEVQQRGLDALIARITSRNAG